MLSWWMVALTLAEEGLNPSSSIPVFYIQVCCQERAERRGCFFFLTENPQSSQQTIPSKGRPNHAEVTQGLGIKLRVFTLSSIGSIAEVRIVSLGNFKVNRAS